MDWLIGLSTRRCFVSQQHKSDRLVLSHEGATSRLVGESAWLRLDALDCARVANIITLIIVVVMVIVVIIIVVIQRCRR